MSAQTPPAREWSLDILRVIAIAGVVSIHTFGNVVVDPAVHGSARWWYAVIMDAGFVWAVPVFVMISGALILAPRQHERGPAWFYRRRLLRLAPAFVFWPIFYVVVVRVLMLGQHFSPSAWVAMFVDGKTYSQLYFLWLIVGLYAVAPVLAAFLREGGRRRALMLAACVLAATTLTWASASLLTYLGHPRPMTLISLTQWVPYVGYFVAGWALAQVRLRGLALAAAAAATAALLAGYVWLYGTADQHPLLAAALPNTYPGPLVVLASIGIFVVSASLFAKVAPGPRVAAVLRELSDAAFGVFLVHFAIVTLLRPLFDPDHPVAVTALWLVTLVLSFAAAMVMRRIPGVRRLV
ncbi:acyltransferase [Microbacterium stercoris]|uniref:Acyltransferase family protein n=1 Tax=Microbacterium stercoris TaxID=2820289 RepID=A0A939QQQ9_9MICO|nr:acyltransferase family protein [Microbacterium stercoris]MBO3664990.1 acyltransferase family protein [Microbacterium stercoris]